jgi:leucyl aminopeptidase
MKRVVLCLGLLAQAWTAAASIEFNVCQLEAQSVAHDAVLVVVPADQRLDQSQMRFLEHFANREMLFLFDQVVRTKGKKSGTFQLPGDTPCRFIWLTVQASVGMATQDVLAGVRSSVGKKLIEISNDEITSLALLLPDQLVQAAGGWERVTRELAIVAHAASYSFKMGASIGEPTLARIDLAVADRDAVQPAAAQGSIIGRYLNLARRWGDEPAGTFSARVWGQQLAHAAGQAGCTSTVLDVHAMRALGMGGILAVGAGSADEAALLVLEYTPKNPIATIALVGKGIIFDSGGLHLKVGSSMNNMKFDKCGGAAALAACLAVAQLNVPLRVVAIVPAVSNKTGSNAMHPRDIVRMMNGTTVEINNTDAEGRLVLADALCYAQKMYNPDVLIDIATLTGACPVALGSLYSGLMSRHDRLKNDLIAAGRASGELVWELPFDRAYEVANDSDVADLSNSPKPMWGAGASMGGLFLSKFVTTSCWAHLDIAGTAYGSTCGWLATPGATGSGVRLLVEYITNYRLDA